MKIAQVVCTFPPYRGGIGNSVQEIAKNLSKNGYKITVFTPNYQNIQNESSDDYAIKRLNPLFKFGNAALLPGLIWELNEFDVIHLHVPFIGGTFPILFNCLLYPRKKLIITYHMDLVGGSVKKIFFGAYKIFLRLALLRANKIIISSVDYIEKSDLAKFYKRHAKKFVEIPFGVDAEKFFPKGKDNTLLEKHFITAKEKVILFVGGLDAPHYFKGLDILLKAIKKIVEGGREDIKLLVIGEGELKQDFQNKAESYNIAAKVIFADGVPSVELANHYNLADVLVLPSMDKSEAFGLVLLEAAACGKPAVASNLPGVRTVVEDGRTGFLAKPSDPDDLKEKIEKILLDEDLRQRMGEAARERALAKYDWKQISENIMSLY